MWCQLVIWSALPVFTCSKYLDHGITQICIIKWPDFSETCLSVVGDPPLNDNYYAAVESYVSHFIGVTAHEESWHSIMSSGTWTSVSVKKRKEQKRSVGYCCYDYVKQTKPNTN